ncbi:MAG TPA: hypothetical protein PKK69_04695 [Ferruginibacter sp.]|nr:hypothetical protein [Ferruginibacter sp.]
MAAVENGHLHWLVIVAVLFAAMSAYYYFRVIQAMYFKPAPAEGTPIADTTTGYKLMLGLVAFLILLLGIFPELLIGWMYH